MKTLIISNLYPPHTRGGAELVAQEMVDSLRMGGEVVDVLTTCPWYGVGSLVPQSDGRGVYRFFPLNLYHTLDDFRYGWWARALWHVIDMLGIHSACVVIWMIARGGYGRVVTHNLKGVGMSIPLVVRIMGVRHEHYLHDVQLIVPSGLLFFGYEREAYYRAWYVKCYRVIMRLAMAGVAEVIAPSQWVVRIHQGHGFFPHAHVRMIQRQASAQKDSVRPVHSRIHFLYIGQISKHKGILFLLDCLNMLAAREVGKFQLTCLGDGPEFASIVSRYGAGAPWLRMVGKVSHEDISRYFLDADYLVFPTLCYENAPNVLREAHENNCPFIASNIGGVSEFVRDKDMVVAPGDAEAWCDVLMQCVTRSRTMR